MIVGLLAEKKAYELPAVCEDQGCFCMENRKCGIWQRCVVLHSRGPEENVFANSFLGSTRDFKVGWMLFSHVGETMVLP